MNVLDYTAMQAGKWIYTYTACFHFNLALDLNQFPDFDGEYVHPKPLLTFAELKRQWLDIA